MAGLSDLMRTDGSNVGIGNRVSADGYYGTIRYIGEVPPTKGLWFGVEWDDASRGRHDGSHEGVRYFKTSNLTSGSFIRPRKSELGITCFEAICDRYGKLPGDNGGVNPAELFFLDKNHKSKTVEMVGAKSVNEKQGKLDSLHEVVLREKFVYGPGQSLDLKAFTHQIRYLNLSRSLLASWYDIANIAAQLPLLENLDVSENRLSIPDDPASLARAFTKVTVLCLNQVQYTWQEILKCSSFFPELEELHVRFNRIKGLSHPGKALSRLRTLNLESNGLSSYEEILILGELPELETLLLSDNKLEKIYFPDTSVTGTTRFFPNLMSLSLNRNKISEWSSVNELNKIRFLEKLRFKSNPVTDTQNVENTRQLIIARIGGLKMCNQTEIYSEERKGAEIDYLKKVGPAWLAAGGNPEPEKNTPSPLFIVEHPRYRKLVDVWGAPEEAEMVQQSKCLKDGLIRIMFSSPIVPEKSMIEKKLPATMTVQKLRTLVNRLYKADGDIRLSYISQRMKGPEIEIENDLQTLSYYSIESGDTITVKW